ncbi:hypothetical protein FAGAP_7159 [Fusarium agapanthi]|uniref:Nephrocystin 3-like N-terminal domain-containing protein n=1 Tax=Fusarium agapanthi TaxID=1803897 RepID=A0A9P5B856_9HYPO|nr:hypothetical protein FAGAP_7159 [Fusarium agapanthi]
MDRKDNLKILDWLTTVDHGLQQSEFQKVQEPGTGRWLIETSEYRNWFKTPGQTLFCQGIPGVGKTVLTSGLIDHLGSKLEGDSASGISYIFCNFQRQDQQTSDGLLLYYNINLFATSRFDTTIWSEISSSFKNNTSLEIYAARDDIGAYIEGSFNMLPSDIRQNKDLRRDIIDAVNWGHHERDSSMPSREFIEFLDDEATVSLAMRKALQRFTLGYFYIRHLHIAAYFGLAELVENLLDMGAEVDSGDRTGRTSLSYVAEQGHDAIVVMLLERGARVDSQDGEVVLKWHYYNENTGRTPLSFATEQGHETAVYILIAHGASSVKSKSGRTPLSHAVEKRRESLVRLFLDTKPGDTNIELGRAVENEYEAIVEWRRGRLLTNLGIHTNTSCNTRQ